MEPGAAVARIVVSMTSRRRLGVVALFLALTGAAYFVGCGQVKRPDGGEGLLPVGASAPDVAARGEGDTEVRLSQLRGQPVVVYFYPADGTPGCTKEACAFRDTWAKFEAAKVGVIGVSSNSLASHKSFRAEEHLPFPLASDENGSVGSAYGVTKKLWGYDRVTFLVDKEGKIARVWPSVDPAVHAVEVLAAAASIK
jgi:thioredoxin-dependent peroxiredoxin